MPNDDDDDDALDSLPALDGEDNVEAPPLEEAGMDLPDAQAGEDVGLDDATGSSDPIDTAWLDAIPDDSVLTQPDEAVSDPSLDSDLEPLAEEGASWVDAGGREERWEEDGFELNDVDTPAADDGGVLDVEELLGDDGLGDDEVDLPPLAEMDDDGGAVGVPGG